MSFSALKIFWNLSKKNSVKNIRLLGFLLMKSFKIFDYQSTFFLKVCPMFVGSVNNFGRSDDDMI